MTARWLTLAAAAVLTLGAAAAQAQTKLKWAHVYETSEPFHTQSVWAAEEIEKRTNGRYQIDVYPGLPARQGNRHQPGPDARHRRHHHLRLELRGPQLSADRRHLLPLHLPRRRTPHRLHQERRLQGAGAKGYSEKTGHHITGRHLLRHPAHDAPTSRSRAAPTCRALKIRVPDVPAYLAMPRACGANTAPIAFAEVYLALQNGTVEAQENPLTTIEAKKFYEVQKHIVADRPHRRPPQHGDLERALGEAVRRGQEDLHRGRPGGGRSARPEIQATEKELVQFFKDKGLDCDGGRQGRLQEHGPQERDRSSRSATARPTRTGSRPSRANPPANDGPAGPLPGGARPTAFAERSGRVAPRCRTPKQIRGGMPMAAEVHTPITGEELAHTFEEQGPEIDLRDYAVEDWVDAGHLLGDGARRLPAVLHPLRAQQLPRLDRGDRHQLPGRGRVSWAAMCVRLGAAHPGRLPVPLPAGQASPVRLRPRSMSSAPSSSPMRRISSGASWTSIGDETHDDDRPAEDPSFLRVRLRRLRADVRALGAGLDRELAARLLHPRAARRLRRRPI